MPGSSSPTPQIEVSQRVGVRILTLRGEHDLSTVPAIEQRLDVIGDEGGDIVIDVRGLLFADVAVANTLERARRRLMDRDSRLVLVWGTGEPVERLFRMLRLTERFECEQSIEAALFRLRRSPDGV